MGHHAATALVWPTLSRNGTQHSIALAPLLERPSGARLVPLLCLMQRAACMEGSGCAEEGSAGTLSLTAFELDPRDLTKPTSPEFWH